MDEILSNVSFSCDSNFHFQSQFMIGRGELKGIVLSLFEVCYASLEYVYNELKPNKLSHLMTPESEVLRKKVISKLN